MDEDDIRKSRFNAGVAFTERIDALQRAINAAKFNPLMKNMETGTFNYEVMIASADCLVAEGWDKLSMTEKELLSRMNILIKKIHKMFPPVSFDRNGEMKIHQQNYERLLAFFELYERKIKELYGEHNINSPNSEDDEGL